MRPTVFFVGIVIDTGELTALDGESSATMLQFWRIHFTLQAKAIESGLRFLIIRDFQSTLQAQTTKLFSKPL